MILRNVILAFGLCVVGPIYGEEDHPITLEAEIVTCEKDKNICTATGNVRITEGLPGSPPQGSKDAKEGRKDDTKEGPKKDAAKDFYTLHAKNVRVYFSGSKAENDGVFSKKSIEKFEAFEDVVVTKGSLTIKSENAMYNMTSNVVDFFGNVSIQEGQRTQVFSDKASLDRGTGIYKVHGVSKPVKILFKDSVDTSSQSQNMRKEHVKNQKNYGIF